MYEYVLSYYYTCIPETVIDVSTDNKYKADIIRRSNVIFYWEISSLDTILILSLLCR